MCVLGDSHEERGGWFTVVCLGRGVGVEGFDSQGFSWGFGFYGG